MKQLCCLLLVAILVSISQSADAKENAPTLFDVRGWILLTYDMDYLRGIIGKAPDYGINHIQLSHDILHHADEALSDEQKRRDVNELAALCHANKMSCYVWTHEVRQPEPEMMKDGKVVIDAAFWKWIRDRYIRFFAACPDVDGLVISFSEGDFTIDSPDEVTSDYTVEEMYQHLIRTVYDVCHEHGKTLMVRKFSDAALQAILDAPEDLIVMQKCTIADWQVYSANNPNLGTYGNHRQICEFDLAGEYDGQGGVPWCAPGYLQSRFRFAAGRGMSGMVARIDRNGRNAFGTPNEINIDFYSELLKDPDADVNVFWKRWAEKRFGKNAAPAAIEALRPTFDLTNRLYWGDRIGDWRIQEHSEIPSWDYALSHDRDYMFSPPVNITLFSIPGRIESEMARRYGALYTDTRRVIERLEENKRKFREADYDTLSHYLNRLDAAIKAFESVHTAFIRFRVLQEKGNAADLDGKLKQDIAKIRDRAKELETRISPSMALINAEKLRAFADDLESETKRIDEAQ